MSNLNPTELKRLHRGWRRQTEARLAIGLEGVQGPFNVGAILRTAAAYKSEHLWLTPSATGPENAKVGKTALGTERFMMVTRVDDGPALVEAARAAGFKVIGVELAHGAVPSFEADLTGDVCLVVGNEDHGMSKATMAACDALIYLPQLGSVGSLNVASAASIACYEWARQQLVATPTG